MKENFLRKRHWGIERGYTSIFAKEIQQIILNSMAAEQVLQLNELTDDEQGASLAWEASRRVFGAAQSINGHNHVLDREVWAGIVGGLIGEIEEWGNESMSDEQYRLMNFGFHKKLRHIYEGIIGSNDKHYHPDHRPSTFLHWDVIGLHAADLSNMAGNTANTYYRLGRMNMYSRVIDHRNSKKLVYTSTDDREIKGLVIDAVNCGNLARLESGEKKEYIDGVNAGLINLFPYYYIDLHTR